MKVDDLPLVLTPKDVRQITGWGERRVYEIIHSKGFPKIQDRPRGRITIPRDAFLRWLERRAEAGDSESEEEVTA